MEEKHDIVVSKFCTRLVSNSQNQRRPHIAAQMEKAGIRLVVFKGASSNLAVELVKAMVRYLVNWQAPNKVYLVCGKTDLCKGINGLAMVIAENYGLELYSET